VLLVAWSRAPTTQLIGLRLPEFRALTPRGFRCQREAAFGHELFDILIAQAEAEVESDATTDNFRRETMALVGDLLRVMRSYGKYATRSQS
jgi:hypothetical protein